MSLLWLRVALVLYSIAALAVLPAALYDRANWIRLAVPAAIAAALFHFVSLATLLPALRPGRETILLAHSGWVFVHIVLLLAAYAALFLSLLASVLYLVQERRLKAKQPAIKTLPPLETTDQIALKTLLFGLPCMTGGLLIGSALAEQLYGPAFFADPKILLAFAMWFAYCVMIFIRRHSGLRRRRAVYLSSFVFIVVVTVWAANQFSSVHRFTTP